MSERKVFLEYEERSDDFPLGKYRVRIDRNSHGNDFCAIELGANYFLFHGEYRPDNNFLHGEPLDTISIDQTSLAVSTLYSKAFQFGEKSSQFLDAELVDTTPHGNRNKIGDDVSTVARL